MSYCKQAIKWMKEGKKVGRKGLFLNKQYVWQIVNAEGGNKELTTLENPKTQLILSDFEATDWEIYCEEHEWIFEHAEGDSCGHNKMVCEKLRCFMGRCKNCGMEKPKEIELKKRTFPERIAYFKNKFDQGDIDEQSYMIQIEAAVEAFK